MKTHSNQCTCILCHVGRNVKKDMPEAEKVIALIRAYDLSQSPYIFTEDSRLSLIEWIEKHTITGFVHLDAVEYFFWERV